MTGDAVSGDAETGDAVPGDETPEQARGRSRAAAVLLALGGAALALVAAGRPWVRQVVEGLPADAGTSTGGAVVPACSPLGLVMGAGAVVLATAGPMVRRVGAGVLVAAGAGLCALVGGVWVDPQGVLTAWPAVAFVAGVLAVGAGGVAVVRSGRWSSPQRRFEPGPTTREPAPRQAPPDVWDALTRGEDPT